MYNQERNRGSRPDRTAGQADEDSTAWVRNCLKEAYPVPGGSGASLLGWTGPRPRRNTVIKLPATVKAIEHRVSEATAAADDAIDLTEISFCADLIDAVDAEPERRSDDRATLSVYRSATLRWAGFEALCLIRNISPGGMMGILHKTLAEGEQVTVEIRSGNFIPGHVAWSRDEMTGVRFDERIDVLQVLQAPSTGEPGAIQRMPRLRIASPTSVQRDGNSHQVTLVDVSQGGAKVEADFLREHDDVILNVRGLDPRRGTVRWVREGRAGIAFLASVPFDKLARWAVERQAEADQGAK
ncbi:PilZ domain-containing protein [Sphingomonas sp. AOB5]|uniref:PilZ domain-containing protein n=1 Tax=Sphingomonas sp. AOB5 TaxID=3034017 RepID=UPI0023F8FFF9|nr:PilZ domain-containing protein [Sphingomonas sp. AOB5]MDF7776977.1 PilZ domain-containing protein [Sphingomonas sp. AOB5]